MKPWLWLPPQLAHDISPWALRFWTSWQKRANLEWRPLTWQGLHFCNRLGIAGGVDKNAENLESWWRLGVGFVEIGTVTPEPQGPNPGRIMQRSMSDRALWNRMGFPSAGIQTVRHNLQRAQPYHTPVFVNIGKNRHTSNELAHQDYVRCFEELRDLASAFVVNISSPNTTGLRDLQSEKALADLLQPLMAVRRLHPKPILLKLSPDLSDSQLDAALQTSLDHGIDGWIFTNTTLQRSESSVFPKEGGVSGAPLATLSRALLQKAVRRLGHDRGQKLVISAGGVMEPKDVMERLELGADLVEIYTALIFHGPGFFRKTFEFTGSVELR